MAWTAPRTYVSAEIITASILNTHIRDNLLETAPAKVTTAGDIVYATAANTITRLAVGAAGTLARSTGSAPEWADPEDGSKLDGDKLDIDFTPSNYTPSTTPAEADDVDDLAAHLAGIDDQLGALVGPIRKSAEETVNASTTLQNDDDFSFSVAANDVWLVRLYLGMVGTQGGGFKFSWSLPAGATFGYQFIGGQSDAGNGNGNVASDISITPQASGTAITVLLGSAGVAIDALYMSFVIIVSGTAGTAQFQWAQETSSGTDLKIESESFLLRTTA